MSDFNIDIERHINKLGNEIQNFVDRMTPESIADGFRPRADIIESDKEFKLMLDLPGMRKSEISLAIKDDVLTVKGERVIEISENESFKKHERKAGAFSRSFALPQDVNSAEIKAKFSNGVLTVVLPKSDILKDATSIPID